MVIKNALVIVTGASSGIGAATAKAMARSGARVVLLARRQEVLDRLVAEIGSAGRQAWAFAIDLRDPNAVAIVAARILGSIGTPDLIVNNAGTGQWRFVEETQPNDAVEYMAVPYFAAFNVVHAFLPALLARHRGHIVNVSSVGSRFVWPGATAYLAARWAMRGFTEALRADLAGTGIQITFFECGTVNSPYWDQNPGSRERIPRVARLIPELSPQEVAQAIVRGVERNKRTIVIPFMMQAVCWLHAIFPQAVQWLMTKTGYRRPGHAVDRR